MDNHSSTVAAIRGCMEDSFKTLTIIINIDSNVIVFSYYYLLIIIINYFKTGYYLTFSKMY